MPLRRADRLFLLVQLLRAKRITTADELARELRVSVRTVYRDIADLVEGGVPIDGEAGVGYRLHRGFELPPMTFTPGELEALVLGARMVEAWGDAELGAAARAVLTKIRAVLPGALVPALDDAALFALERPWSDDARANLPALRRAIAARRKVALVYETQDGTSSARVVRPLGLYFWGTTWTLAAWCELREGYRNFRPDRIVDLQVTSDGFDVDHGPSLSGFMDSMRAQAETE